MLHTKYQEMNVEKLIGRSNARKPGCDAVGGSVGERGPGSEQRSPRTQAGAAGKWAQGLQ